MGKISESETETPQRSKVFGPYSPIRKAGELYFTSGHIGYDAVAGVANADIAVQTKKALENLMDTLASAGLTSKDVVKTTLFVTDMGDFSVVNKVYMGFFSDPRPARSTVAVKELPRVAGDVPIKIEIEAVAMAAAKEQN